MSVQHPDVRQQHDKIGGYLFDPIIQLPDDHKTGVAVMVYRYWEDSPLISEVNDLAKSSASRSKKSALGSLKLIATIIPFY